MKLSIAVKKKKKVTKGKKTPTTNTLTTPTTSTTKKIYNFTIKPWGYLNKKNNILLYYINDNKYLYRIGNILGIGSLEYVYNKKTFLNCNFQVELDKAIFNFTCYKKPRPPLYELPSQESIDNYLKGKYKIKTSLKLFNEIKDMLEIMYDFTTPIDSTIISLFIMQSYVDHLLEAVFLLGIDAKMGAGKTTLLEIVCKLEFQGVSAGDISKAALPREKEDYNIKIGIDELDQLPDTQRTELESIARRSQRRGNPYIRVNKNTMETEIFNLFGQTHYTFRSESEDALKNRSFPIRTQTSTSMELPIINFHKSKILRPLMEDLFFWWFENATKFYSGSGSWGSKVVEVGGVLDRVKKEYEIEIKKRRSTIYKLLTLNMSKKELEVLKDLVGRNMELGYIMLEVSKIINIDLCSEISRAMNLKQEEERVSDSLYLELFSEFLVKLIKVFQKPNTKEKWLLGNRSEYTGFHYYPKNQLHIEFNNFLKEKGVPGIGSPKFSQYLKDFGFVQGINMCNQKHLVTKKPTMSIIIDDSIQRLLNLKDPNNEINT